MCRTIFKAITVAVITIAATATAASAGTGRLLCEAEFEAAHVVGKAHVSGIAKLEAPGAAELEIYLTTFQGATRAKCKDEGGAITLYKAVGGKIEKKIIN
jgi:hypothetical protein